MLASASRLVYTCYMPIPEKIGRYIIKSELGRGGMATVYRAHDPLFEREVALKILPREMLHDPQFRSRFEREIKMVASLEHPAIVPVYDVGEEDGQPFFVMRYMTGGSLSDLISKGQFTIEEAAIIIGKVAQGLAYAHRKGIIHRDLKPDNILFDENGDPFISDFGIAKLSESGNNLTGSGVIGTPAYMSPEQAQGGEIDGRSDVYGLGVILYQMISGQQPYSADTPMGVVVKHITEPVPEILRMMPDLPIEMDEIIKMAMAKDKTKRYENTIELAKALNKIAFGSEGNLTFTSNTGIQSRLGSNNTITPSRNKTGIIVVAVITVIALLGFFLIRNQLVAPTEQPTTTIEAPTLVTITETTAPIFAPACSANVKPPEPEVKLTDNRCSARKPYAYFTMPLDATVESLSAEAKCQVEATSNGKQVVSCVGTNFLILQAKFCLPPPPPAPSDLNQCSPNSTFNPNNQCCMAIAPQDAGCIVQEVQLKGCE
jgi:serine/threonine protein kinase